MSKNCVVAIRLLLLPLITVFIVPCGTLFAEDRDQSEGAASYERMLSLGYQPLFNRNDLTGWRNPYDHGEAQVVDGEIHLVGDKKFFLVSEEAYSDFRLSVEIKLPEGQANSGIMFRCHVKPNRVYGYQAECDGSSRGWSGGLYDEGRRNWIWPSKQGRSEGEYLSYASESQAFFKQPEIRNAFQRNGWNRYDIECIGDRIVICINGVEITRLRDSRDARGFIGIQHHGEKGQLYRFRNLFIKELPERPAEGSVEIVEQGPKRISQLTSGNVLVDFGRVAFGNLELRLPENTLGEATIHFGEKLEAGRVDRKPPGTIRYAATTVDLGQSQPLLVAPPVNIRNTQQAVGKHPPAVLTPQEWRPVIPFRWVEIEGLETELKDDLVVRRAAFAKDWDDGAATFTCSDPTLNRIWELCRYSIKATTFAGVYVDGDRERIPYEADAYLNQLSHYYCDNDVQMARKTFDWLMENGTWPTEWAPHMVFMAHADWMRTGDKQWLSHRYESLKRKTLENRLGSHGLVVSNEKQRTETDIVDWPRAERDGYVFTEINTVVNAFHLAAIRQMIELAAALNRTDDQQAYQAHYDSAYTQFQRLLFIEEQGLYRDGIGTDHTSLHANLFPLAFGLVPEEKQPVLVKWLHQRGMKCSVYAAQYLLEGLFQNDAGQQAVELMTADNDRSWQHMLANDATITWEAWDIKYKPNLDWNHAWGAAPANLLPRFILGVQPLSAGWERAIIAPKLSGLSYASGKIPTPKGPISVDWSHNTGLHLAVKLPPGMAARVEIPNLPETSKLLLDGVEVSATLLGDHWRLDEEITGSAKLELR